jgi:ribosome-binding protein aMBF1 (putative translation factor)
MRVTDPRSTIAGSSRRWEYRALGLAECASEKPELSASCSLSLGRVALLGIAQRHIRISFSHTLRKQRQAKPLQGNIQSLGDWIHIKRREKNMAPCYLAAKMGIATALIRSWESGSSQPDRKQLQDLAHYFGLP